MKKLLPIFILALASPAFAQKDDESFHLDKEYKVSATGTINLKASDAKVIITGSSRETAHVKIDRVVTTKGWQFGGRSFGVDIDEEAGGLTIREQSHSSGAIIGYYSEKYSILLEVPAGASVIVDGDDGHYSVKNINGAISFDLDDANVDLTDCGGSSFYFKVDDGHVNMNGGKGKLEIKGDDADFRITNAAFTSIVTSTDDGNLSIETSLTDHGDYRINAEDGRVTLSVTGGGGKIDVRHDDSHVVADAKFELTKDTDSEKIYTMANGNANVAIRTDDAKVRLISR